jgi:hypothetical protein
MTPRGVEIQREALAGATVINQLEVEATNASGGLEHLGLELAGGVPGCIPAVGGVEGEDEASGGARGSRGALPETR